MKVCHFRDDFSNAFVTKRQTDRLRREAFGVRRIPALCESSARREAKAPEYGALQTLRAIWLRLGRAVDPAKRDALPTVSARLPFIFHFVEHADDGAIVQLTKPGGFGAFEQAPMSLAQ